MKPYKFIYAIALFLVLPVFSGQTQDIIEAKELVKIMRQPTTVIVSARKPSDYNKVHILGAVNINHNDLYDENTMLLPAAEIASQLGAVGISASKTIVLYDGGSEKYAGRMYWILKYLGATDVKILNGGMPAWKEARKPLTSAVPAIKPTTFKVNVHPEYLATTAEVQKAINNPAYVLIDARSPGEYAGTVTTGLDRPGRIPSSINIEYLSVLDDKGKLKSNEEIQAIFTKKGVTKDKTVIVYCKTSVRAGILFHVLSSALHYPKVKLYDGAFFMWQQNSSNKVVQ